MEKKEYKNLEDSVVKIHGIVKKIKSEPQKKTGSLYDRFNPGGAAQIFNPYIEFDINSDTHNEVKIITVHHDIPLRPEDEIYAYVYKADKIDKGVPYAPEIKYVDRQLEVAEQAHKIELLLDKEVRAIFHAPYEI